MDLDRISHILKVECQLDPDLPVMVGVSGGPDSLALFHVLLQIGQRVIPAHFNHKLRSGSAADLANLTGMLATGGHSLISGEADVRVDAAAHGLNIEEAARNLRYGFLFDQARLHKAQAVVVGHTADDQVETVLMHLLRGSGTTGLMGMSYCQQKNPWDATIPVVRPLLDTWRWEIIAYCDEHNLAPLQDETNADPAYLRNRIRHQLLPILESDYNPQVKKAIHRLSRTIQGEDQVRKESLNTAWQGACLQMEDTFIRLDRHRLDTLSTGMRQGLIHLAVQTLISDKAEVGFAAVERVVDLVQQGRAGREIQVVEGIYAILIQNELLLSYVDSQAWMQNYPQISKTQVLKNGHKVLLGKYWSLRIALKCISEPITFQTVQMDPNLAMIDADRLDAPLVVRNARPGERIQPFGMEGGTIKVSDLFINEKIPRRIRAHYPVVACEDKIVWIPGYRLAHQYRITSTTTAVILLELLRQ